MKNDCDCPSHVFHRNCPLSGQSQPLQVTLVVAEPHAEGDGPGRVCGVFSDIDEAARYYRELEAKGDPCARYAMQNWRVDDPGDRRT